MKISMENSTKNNATALLDIDEFGIPHITTLTIVVEGKQIESYKYFELKQSATTHHQFSLTLYHDSLGEEPEDHWMEQSQKLLGKRILVTFTFKNIDDGPERDFIGVITKVGLGRENKNHGNIILEGYSPTILLDGAPLPRVLEEVKRVLFGWILLSKPY